MTVILATFTNADLGIEARIAEYYTGGYSVVLFDTDADLAFPAAKVVATLDDAVVYAKTLVA